MSLLSIGLLYGGVTLFAMFIGMPIAFWLGAVATLFMIAFMPHGSGDTITQNVYEEMASITLLSIPLFILKGAAIGRSPAGRDLYGALHAWMHWIPGGLGIANVFACALFAAMAGSSPATRSAIGSAGIPEMRKHGYSPRFASGVIAAGGTPRILLPPPITLILHSVAAQPAPRPLLPPALRAGALARRALRRLRDVQVPARIPCGAGSVQAHRRALGAAAGRHTHGVRQVRAAAAGPALRHSTDRCDGRALRRLRHSLGNRGLRRRARSGADRIDPQRVDATRFGADSHRHATGVHYAHDDHRHVAAVFLRDELPAYQPIDGAVDRFVGALALGAARGDPADGHRARFLPPTGVHHPDDGTDHPASAQGGRLRSHLVRRDHDHRHGDGADSSAGGPEHFRHQEYRPGYPLARRGMGGDAVCRADDARRRR